MSTSHIEAGPAIRTLSEDECLSLLKAESVGRIGFAGRDGVEIIPVGYRVGAGPRLFVSTQTWGIVGQLAECGARCSFEVDHHASTLISGWSVLMQGELSRLDAAGTAAYKQLDRTLDPWPGYSDARPVQFVPRSFSGRSVLRLD